MNVNLQKYTNLKICVAVSGGRDSMALLHYLNAHAAEYNITLTALNCDHGMRGETSARDSAFVAGYCEKAGIPLSSFVAGKKPTSENDARSWRFGCYLKESQNCDCVATAHHLNDNAETVLFNLARGTALAGMEGITDEDFSALAGRPFKLIRPFIACTRTEIDEYIEANSIPYVDDETNFKTDYTRNKIRHNVLPALDEAVPGAARAIYRFSRLAAEDEEYLRRKADKLILRREPYGCYILFCGEKVIFRRAAAKIVAAYYGRKDYTSEQLEHLFELQFAENGKKFEFLGLYAFHEDGRVCITEKEVFSAAAGGRPYADFLNLMTNKYCGQIAHICRHGDGEDHLDALRKGMPQVPFKALRFDGGKVPASSAVRFMRAGDKFTKFGGGTKNLGDWFTDKKIPVRLRGSIPLLADGNDILIVFGVEISEKVKVDKDTKDDMCAIAADYGKI